VANIAITSQCNLSCLYCFAQAEFNRKERPVQHMPLPIYAQALAFVKRSQIHQVRILGGEPTLHPQFIEFLQMARETGLPIQLFSNGLISESILEFLSEFSPEQLNIILNVTRLEEGGIFDDALERVMQRLHDKIVTGLNIYRLETALDFLIDLIIKYDLQKSIRLGIAHPCVGYQNRHLHSRYFPRIGEKIANLAMAAQPKGIRINLDCGFTTCMFAGYDLEQLGLNPQLGNHCQPILDILPDGHVISCYALSGVGRVALTESSTAEELRRFFAEKTQAINRIGVYKICSICNYRSQELCSGGGTCHKVERLTADK